MPNKNKKPETFTFEYQFELENGESINHIIEVSRDSMISKYDEPNPIAEWTKLEFHQCEGCPLKDSEHCPVALRLASPIRKFKALSSFAKAKVTVKSEDRVYIKETDLQDGLRSMFGLIMATSGCPALKAFQPMARFHLPFSSMDETVYRVISMYILERFFASEPANNIQVNIDEIQQLYDTIHRVNQGVFERLKHIAEKDGMLNAVAILDTFATLVPFYVESKLSNIRDLFTKVAK